MLVKKSFPSLKEHARYPRSEKTLPLRITKWGSQKLREMGQPFSDSNGPCPILQTEALSTIFSREQKIRTSRSYLKALGLALKLQIWQ